MGAGQLQQGLEEDLRRAALVPGAALGGKGPDLDLADARREGDEADVSRLVGLVSELLVLQNRGRAGVVGAMAAQGGEVLAVQQGVDLGCRHHAVVRAVAAAACGQKRVRGGGGAESRGHGRKTEDHQQDQAQQASHRLETVYARRGRRF